MIVLLDTNIFLDALQERQPFDVPAKDILKRAQNREMTCLFTANTAADIFYLYSKTRDIKSAKIALGFLLEHYGVVSVTHDDCKNAMSLPIEDFEDALVSVCALKANVDYIITRDEKFLKADLPVRRITSNEFIDMLKSQ